jgi:hypothetical protein
MEKPLGPNSFEHSEHKDLQYLELHPSEMKLIEAIRAIGNGEIEVLKIQNRLPMVYKISLGMGDFHV